MRRPGKPFQLGARGGPQASGVGQPQGEAGVDGLDRIEEVPGLAETQARGSLAGGDQLRVHRRDVAEEGVELEAVDEAVGVPAGAVGLAGTAGVGVPCQREGWLDVAPGLPVEKLDDGLALVGAAEDGLPLQVRLAARGGHGPGRGGRDGRQAHQGLDAGHRVVGHLQCARATLAGEPFGLAGLDVG